MTSANSYKEIFSFSIFTFFCLFILILGKTPPSDLTTILNELNDDIIPHNGEIFNPFTPVVSPTEERNQSIDKIYVQTSSNGYRAVDNNFYKSTDDLDSNK